MSELLIAVAAGLLQPTDPSLIRDDIKLALDQYGAGVRPYVGGFLTAVLSNDLREAVGRADDYNLRTLPAIVAYCWNELPGNSWGSEESVQRYRASFMSRPAPETETPT